MTCQSLLISVQRFTLHNAINYFPIRTHLSVNYSMLPKMGVKTCAPPSISWLLNSAVMCDSVATLVLSNSGFDFYFFIFVSQSSEGTPTTTGWFEVQVNGVLVHSKKVRIIQFAILYHNINTSLQIVPLNKELVTRKGTTHHFHFKQKPCDLYKGWSHPVARSCPSEDVVA